MPANDLIHLAENERLVARSKKLPYALIFQILFNRAFPAIVFLLLPIFYFMNPTSFQNGPVFKMSEMSTLNWIWLVAIMPIGVSLSAYLVWSYVKTRVLLTDSRLIFIKGHLRRRIPYQSIQKVEIKNGLVDSELLITMGKKDILSIDYLENGDELAEIIKSQMPTNQSPIA